MAKEVTVKLSFDHKDGGFKDEAGMLSWISSCLNCNTNHVSAGVQKAPSPEALVMLSIESRNFTFDAVGRDLEHAQQVLLAGWSKHREQFGDVADRMPAADLAALSRAFDIRERSIAPGEFYRDHELLDLRRNAQEDRAHNQQER